MKKTFDERAKGAQAILLAAERLFGEHGLDGVSLRQILAAARQSNTSAVQLHFGSKQGLIQAVYEMRTPLIEAGRQAMLDTIIARNDCHIAPLLGALLMPIVDSLPATERMLYARFTMRLLPLSREDHPHFKALEMCGASYEIERRILVAQQTIPADVVNTRIRAASSVFLQGIWDQDRVRALPSHPYRSEDIYWDEIMQMALSVMLNPYPPLPRSK